MSTLLHDWDEVACLHVVFGSANAHEYYREFQHADGLQLVLKIVAIYGTAPHSQTPLVSVTDRETLFRIILRISKMSRQCKEDISCLDGELAVIRGVLASGEINDWKAESRVWTLCREILLEQLVGNPNSLDRAHEAVAFMLRHSEVRLRLFGAQVLRELISEKSFSFDPEYRRRKEYDLVPLCLSLLESADVYLQHESLELLHALLQSKHLQVCHGVLVQQETICEKLVRLVGDSAKALDAKVEERFALIEDTTEHETYAHLRSAFTAASQAVNTLMNSNRNMLPILFEQADSDRILNDIEQNVETAARDYVPELQVQTRVGENSDETEEMDILEAQREHHLRVQLQKHFAKFRHIPTAVTTTSSN
ncbi:40S ribosomal protein S27 [Phytophthora nicotianae]|uniref:40S ribosomal protein S27 n=1 Tax=Phytophthora nicotianae TaxID=4792 RepID=A0A0W8D9L3_PHYNI|nr:40S ribosomal protein S27 [Phytophthora nicotianae]